ncbi:MAG TPA: FAD-binding oxidoreductase [Bacillales bacterium]|nr:FAD-binding oxidoreductase [Bacillales bacterium]
MIRKYLAVIVVYGMAMAASLTFYLQKPLIVEDKGRLLPTEIKAIRPATNPESLQKWIRKAAERGEKISVAGMQHSQGGQTYFPGGIMLDMRGYDHVLAYHPEKKTITVQCGATWADVQKVIHPDGLAVRVMQSQNIFTVGGSLSVNAHGRDIRFGSLMDTVQSFRLLTADGEILNVSRTENREWFPLAIGGYGLFGILLDVTLKLTDDELYTIRTNAMQYDEYPDYFMKRVKQDPDVRMHIARISVAPDASFLREMYVEDYVLAEDQSLRSEYDRLKQERFVAVPKFFLGLSRYSDWGKTLLWKAQKRYFLQRDGILQTRNNAMRSDSQFLQYNSPRRTETLQEYYVPVSEFVPYLDEMRDLLEKEHLNLLNITVRFVNHGHDQPVLSYAKTKDMFALVFLINQGLNKEDTTRTTRIVRDMIDLTLAHEGSYYLPYYSYPTKAQFRKAYPHAESFFEAKRKYDPAGVFTNLFYEEYGK